MTFVHPLFLWALAAVAAPVIIHLFNFRKYKKVYFTNVKFLKELQQESKSKSRLREILVLIARCLTIACLVLAFSQPVLRDEKSAVHAGANVVSLYIDNSFSMQNVNRQGPLLQIAKTRAREVINAFGNGNKFQILTNDFEGKHQRYYSKDDALNILEETKPSASVRLFSDVVKRQNDFLNGSRGANRKIYAFSDVQRTTFDLGNVNPDTNIKITLVPLNANRVNNITADSCWFETPLQQKGFIQKLHARIINNGTSSIEAASAKLFLNGQQVAISSFSLDANLSAEIIFTFECRVSGFNYGSIKIEDYPVTFDDELFFAFNSKVNISVGLINGMAVESNALNSLFSGDSLFKLNTFNENTIDYGAFKNSDVIVLNQLTDMSTGMISELVKFTNQGGALVVIPNATTAASYNTVLSNLGLPGLGNTDTTTLRTDKIDFASGFYDGVFEKVEDRLNLPIVSRHYRLLKNTRRDFEPVLTLQNGDVFFGYSRFNNARVYLFSAPLDKASTNFNNHALFVPTFYQVCFRSLKAAPLFYKVRSNVMINVKNDMNLRDQPPHIIKTDNQSDVIPETRIINNSLFIYTRNQVDEPGFYKVNRAGTDLMPLAFNYSRLESGLENYSVQELENMINAKAWRQVEIIDNTDSDISKQVLQGAEGKKLWKLFIILALIFIGLEVALLRLLK